MRGRGPLTIAAGALLLASAAGARGAQDAAPKGDYEVVAGEDWSRFRSLRELRAAELFWWNDPRDVYGFVRLVPDSTFGQAARIVFPRNAGEPGPAPRLRKRLERPLDRMWYRWRMRYGPGWTTAGPDPAGHNNAYKVAFWTWAAHNQRGHLAIINTTQYEVNFAASDRGGRPLEYRERQLPGSPSLGRVTTEWTDGRWWEFVVFYEKTGPTSARQHHWMRRLTPSPGMWTYTGFEVAGAETPRVDAVELGANKNKNNPADMHIDWGPWEVVDGSRFPNPFRVPVPPR